MTDGGLSDLLSPRGRLFVFAGPSGAGKSTICQAVVRDVPGLVFSVSYTTRSPRAGEVDGRDYRFITDAAFSSMADAGDFAEHAVVHAHRYGTARGDIEKAMDGGRDALLDIDVQGARQIRESFPAAVTTFVTPPSLEILRQRLKNRGQNAENDLERRLRRAEAEIAEAVHFDYLIINDVLEDAITTARAVITAERHRVRAHRRDAV